MGYRSIFYVNVMRIYSEVLYQHPLSTHLQNQDTSTGIHRRLSVISRLEFTVKLVSKGISVNYSIIKIRTGHPSKNSAVKYLSKNNIQMVIASIPLCHF